MAIKQQPATNFIDRSIEAHDHWIKHNLPKWLSKTLLLEDGGLLTPISAAHKTRWFTWLLLGLSVLMTAGVFIERYLLQVR